MTVIESDCGAVAAHDEALALKDAAEVHADGANALAVMAAELPWWLRWPARRIERRLRAGGQMQLQRSFALLEAAVGFYRATVPDHRWRAAEQHELLAAVDDLAAASKAAAEDVWVDAS